MEWTGFWAAAAKSFVHVPAYSFREAKQLSLLVLAAATYCTYTE